MRLKNFFFTKIVNSRKLISFHDDIYTKVAMLDNLKNLCLLLESNLKRRSGKTNMLSGLIRTLFDGEEWNKHFKANSDLTQYDSVSNFLAKLVRIENFKSSGRPEVDFLTRARKSLLVCAYRYAFLKFLNISNYLFYVGEREWSNQITQD